MSYGWHIAAAVGCAFISFVHLSVAVESKNSETQARSGLVLISLWLILTAFVLVLR